MLIVVSCAARFDKDFFMDLIFRAATDDDGKELPATADAKFWENVSKRSVRSLHHLTLHSV